MMKTKTWGGRSSGLVRADTKLTSGVVVGTAQNRRTTNFWPSEFQSNFSIRPSRKKTTAGAATRIATLTERRLGAIGPTTISSGVRRATDEGRRIAQPDQVSASEHPATADSGSA